ncbi:flavin reductase family protein [bacterium]|nr:flavin reductase family protein [bacterium]
MKVSLGAATIALPLPAWVICTYDQHGRANAMTASWTGVCCSVPPCLYFSARESRYTYECVSARRAFTVNIPSATQAAQTDFLGIASGRKVDKLARAGLTTVPGKHVDAPAIVEFPLTLECRLAQQLDLGSHTMFIGEILDVQCFEELLNADGKLDGAKIRAFTYCPADSTYYATGPALGGGYQLGRALLPESGADQSG